MVMQNPDDAREPPHESSTADNETITPAVTSLVSNLLQSYRQLAGSTCSLVFAETQLAASSFALLLGLAVFSAFAVFGLWLCVLTLAAIGLAAVGLSSGWIALLGIVAHTLLLVSLIKPARSCLSNMSFTASREVLRSPASKEDSEPVSAEHLH